VLGKEYMDLVNTVNRADVDKEITRCPHKETSKKMEEVSVLDSFHDPRLMGRQSEQPKQPTTRWAEYLLVSSVTHLWD
jgi:hypothetical protein